MKKRGLLCLLIAGAMALSACGGSNKNSSNFNDEVVMKIDGREIMKSEYMVYLYTTTKSFTAVGGEDIWTTDFDGQTADELVEERTLKTLQSVIAARKYAEDNGITLSDEQKAEVTKACEQFVANVPQEDIAKMGIDAESMAPYIEGTYIYSLVYKALAAECEVDEAEMTNYFEENKEQMRDDYTVLDIDSVLLDDLDKANEVVQKAKDGEDFRSLFEQYDVDENAKQQENGEKMTVYKSQFATFFGIEDIPEIGQIAGPIDVDGSYYVLRVNSITVPEDSEIKTMSDEAFTSQKQADYSDARFEEMMADQKIEYVDEVYNSLEKFH